MYKSTNNRHEVTAKVSAQKGLALAVYNPPVYVVSVRQRYQEIKTRRARFQPGVVLIKEEVHPCIVHVTYPLPQRCHVWTSGRGEPTVSNVQFTLKKM